MGFWNYCPDCGKRLKPNEKKCSSCGAETIFLDNEDNYFFTPPIHNIGFFDLKIDFSPYINTDADFKYDICECGYLNKIDNEFCPFCGVKRIDKSISRFIKKFVKPKFNMDDIEVNNDIICECGAVNSEDSEFCEMCGRYLHEEAESDDAYANFNLEYKNPIFCVCGEENSEDSQYCDNCGIPLNGYHNIDEIKSLYEGIYYFLTFLGPSIVARNDLMLQFFSRDNLINIIAPHYFEFNYSFLKSCDSRLYGSNACKFNDGTYQILHVKNPTSVKIYETHLKKRVFTFTNGTMSSDTLAAEKLADGSLNIFLPNNGEYKYNIEASEITLSKVNEYGEETIFSDALPLIATINQVTE